MVVRRGVMDFPTTSATHPHSTPSPAPAAALSCYTTCNLFSSLLCPPHPPPFHRSVAYSLAFEGRAGCFQPLSAKAARDFSSIHRKAGSNSSCAEDPGARVASQACCCSLLFPRASIQHVFPFGGGLESYSRWSSCWGLFDPGPPAWDRSLASGLPFSCPDLLWPVPLHAGSSPLPSQTDLV